MLYNLCLFVLLFFIYSFIGYIIEIICVSIIDKKIVFSRGYLIGPYLPIFGFGGLIMFGYLSRYENDLLVLFVMSMVSSGLLEYFTSLLLEKIFKLRWWDYSDKKLNINGRVCLENCVLFGFGGIVFVKFINPFIKNILFGMSQMMIIILGIIVFMIMFSDFVFSTFIICQLKYDSSKYTSRDATKYVREQIITSLHKYNFLHKRLFHAFPNIAKNKNFKEMRKAIEDFRKKRKNL